MTWKKTAGAILVVAALWVLSRLPHPATDIGKLEPVSIVQLTRTDSGIRVDTDSGAWGEGMTLANAVEQLKRASSKAVFLETADKVLISGNIRDYWEEIYGLFRPACQICWVIGSPDLKEAGQYLSIHPTDQTLGQLRGGLGKREILILSEGRGILVPE